MHGDLNILLILWESGIVVKIVLLLLIFASIFSWTIIFQKRKSLRLVTDSNDSFYKIFSNIHNIKDMSGHISKYGNSTLRNMFVSGQNELTKIENKISAESTEISIKDYVGTHGISAIERSLKQSVNDSNLFLENKLSSLASIGSVSPFIGLFGTVWGIIDSFSGLASGGGTIEAVAPGIAEALVATAVGLAAAIPAVWFFNIFTNRISSINVQMESFGQDFLNLVEREVLISKDK